MYKLSKRESAILVEIGLQNIRIQDEIDHLDSLKAELKELRDFENG